MKAIKFTTKVWFTSIVLGLVILLAFYIAGGVHDRFGRSVLEAIFMVSFICSLPILILVTISVWFISKTKLTTRSKKLLIALITTLLIIAAIPIYIAGPNGDSSFLRVLFTPSLYIYALPNWLVAMFGIMFYTLEPAETRKT